MKSIENNTFENKNTDESLKNIEKNGEIPEQKYIEVCKKIGKNHELVEQICNNNFNINIRAGLEQKGISFDDIFKKNNLELA